MSADLAARLRALARDHHEGRLNLPTYRKLRAPLLDSLQLHAMDEMAVTQPRSLGRAAGAPAPTRKSTLAAPPPRPTKAPRVIIASVALLLIAAAAWWVVRPSTPHEQVAADSVAPTNPVRDVVQPFVQRGDWSDAIVAHLNVTLLELGQAQIGAVAGEPWFQRFVDDVRKRVKEQQALVQTPLTARSSPLAALAVTVGLDLNSPDAAIRITAPDTVNRFRTSESESVSAAQSEVKIADAPPAPRTKKSDADTSAPKTNSDVVSKAAPNSAPAVASAPRQSTCRPELARSRRPFCYDTLPSGKNGPQLALIPAGEFDMGSVAAASEQPVHRVTIREPFAISVHEVSQAEFNAFCEATGRSCAAQPWSGDEYPVANVSWQDARAYVEWLSTATGFRYRLPSEAQWEYAARAGETGLVPGGDKLSPTDAHYSMLTNLTAPAPRSQKFNDNDFRLMHTLGNLREWVEDAWADNYSGAPSDGAAVSSSANNNMRVARGGSYADGAAKLRLSMREGLPSDTRDALTGFRVLREVP
ncbi:formylglycine-generating enzyme family protein [Steroidobacter sp. S1-65]|uniref:Formylglycine-generating enzyme family protein n=1 Tax=Steroidobacter gossypii TaxID=2805490 RepID=A0ABS1X0D7_9GAMM|nr:formylglycine-generating enzyme family protein [Steroidobacter gossypii]MBM0106711.1 formylglycine-generating enzyme family protein [Steroidobacter gossypii]